MINSSFLLTATPLYGHVAPMLAVGAALRARGHRVRLLTGAGYRTAARDHDLEFVALPPAAELGAEERCGLRRRSRFRVVAGREAIITTFLRPLAAQHDALVAALTADDHDAVISDAAFLGSMPLLLNAARRPPMIGISLTPLSLVSADCAPFGSGLRPGSGELSRRRNQLITWLLDQGPLRTLHRATDATLAPYGIPAGTLNYFDHVAAFDLSYHLAAPAIEYPRHDLPASIRLVGPIRTEPAPSDRLPDWWQTLEHDQRRVVHVTQGTMDNDDLAKLLLPTMDALAAEPVRLVVTTGGRGVATLRRQWGGALPDNVVVADFVPYDRLLPRCSVMITNGGYGGVQQALRHGVPVIVAGDSEEKPEVAARVAWAGVGRDLGTGRPRPRRIREAVRAVLADERYAGRARSLADELAALGDPLPSIVAGIETAVAESVGAVGGGGAGRWGSQPVRKSSTSAAGISHGLSEAPSRVR